MRSWLLVFTVIAHLTTFLLSLNYRGPPPQAMRGGGEADQYYEPRPAEKSQAEEEEDEKESKAGIISQMETIDYSHGGVLPNVQTVDYHHGQASRGEDPSYHERPPPVRVHDYPSGMYNTVDREIFARKNIRLLNLFYFRRIGIPEV